MSTVSAHSSGGPAEVDQAPSPMYPDPQFLKPDRLSHEGSAARLSDLAVDGLRSLIITLALEPGSVLDESVLVQRLGVGRTPLREAIQRLANEGLVVILPRRAVAVSEITVTDLQQIYEARQVFESTSVRLAAARATAADLERMTQHVERLRSGWRADAADPTSVVESDFGFHYTIGCAADNRYIRDSIRRVLGPAMRMTFLAHHHGQPVQDTYDEHSAVLEAIRHRDVDAAERAIRQHITRAKERILNRL